jgi:hypothetical protein
MVRSIFCGKCKQVKEDENAGYCRTCRKEKCREWHNKPKELVKRHTGLCPCGKERASYSPAYCKECAAKCNKKAREKYRPSAEVIARKNERQRIAWHKKYGDRHLKNDPVSADNRLKYKKLAEKSDRNIIRHRVRALTRSYIKAGKLIKQPCEICQTIENVEAHHDDYDKPMDIRWLCRKHHREHHRCST